MFFIIALFIAAAANVYVGRIDDPITGQSLPAIGLAFITGISSIIGMNLLTHGNDE